LEPMALPMAMPLAPAMAAVKETRISGADVPSETTVRPIKSGDMPKLRAKEAEPLTNLSALQTSTAILKKMVSEATSKMFNPGSENSWLLKGELLAIARVVRNNSCP